MKLMLLYRQCCGSGYSVDRQRRWDRVGGKGFPRACPKAHGQSRHSCGARWPSTYAQTRQYLVAYILRILRVVTFLLTVHGSALVPGKLRDLWQLQEPFCDGNHTQCLIAFFKLDTRMILSFGGVLGVASCSRAQ